MKKLYKLIKPITLLVLLVTGFAANAQQVSNGPVNLQIKADAFWKGNYDDVIDNTEERDKVWFRDAANLDGSDWIGGACFQWTGPSGSGGFPLWSNPTNWGATFNYTYGTNVPQHFQVLLEGWEEDSGNDCDYDCSSICIDQDDNHCGPTQAGGNWDFRTLGPPCVWNQTEVTGTCGNYGVRFSSYYTPALPTITGPTSGCGSVTLTGNGATYGGSYNWYNAATGGSLLFSGSTYTVNTPGTYTVYLQVNNSCASLGRTPYTFTVSGTSSGAFNYSSATFCKNGSNPTPTITGVPGGAFTSTPAGLSINGSTGQINVQASNAGTYSVTYTPPGSCPGVVTNTVTIVNADNASFNYAAPSFCQNSGIQSPTIALNGGSFTSNPAGLAITGSNGVVDLNNSSPGTYTITYNTAGACPSSSTQQLTVTPAQSATFTYSNAIYCQDDVTNPTPQVTGTAGGSFTSSPAGLALNSLTGQITLNLSTTGIPYTVTYTSPGPCAASQTYGVTIIDNPSAPVAVSPAAICEGQPTPQLSAAGSGGTINWYDAAIGGSLLQGNSSIYNPPVTTAGTYTYYAEEVGPAACASTRTPVTVTINATPNAPAVGQPSAICIGDNPPTLSASGTNVIFNWYNAPNGGTLLQANSSNYVPTINAPGTYTYYVEAVGVGNCPSSTRTAVTLVVNALPLVGIATSDNTLCANDNSVPIFGFPGGGFFTGSGVSGSTFDPANAPIGSSVVTYTYTDANFCTNSQTQQFIVYDVPVPLIVANGSPVLCNGGDVTLDAGAGYVSYMWSPGGETDQTITVNSSGVYGVEVISTDGCVGVGSNPVTVSLVPDTFIAAPIVGDVTVFCVGTNINTTLDAGSGYSAYTWSPGNEITQTLNVTTPGTYVVTVQNALGCVFVDSVDVGYSTINAQITADGPLLFCLGDSVQLSVNPAYSYLWSSGSTTQAVEVNHTGEYSVIVEDEYGCVAMDTVDVSVEFPPIADFAYGQQSNSLDMNFYDFSSNGTTYSWDFGDGGSSAQTDPMHTFPAPGDYTVTLTVTNSCGEDEMVIVVPVKTVGLPELDIEKFTIYPNPTDGNLMVRFNSTTTQAIDIRVMNLVGQQLFGDSMNNFSGSYQKSYDLGSLPAGVYLFQIVTEKGSRTERVILSK